jgi:hypothetical protein
MYTLYYLLLNTVYIKNSPTCFELCYFIFRDTTNKQMANTKQQIQCPQLNTFNDILSTNFYILMSIIRL